MGCGAVSQLYYVPASRLIPEHSIEWFVDTSIERARQAAKTYGGGNVTTDYREILDRVEAGIVATPNFLHSKISIDFLRAGRDVLCEKPLAINTQEGLEMIKASRYSGSRLAVNFIRRRFDSYRIARDILNRELIGNVTRVTVEEGMVFSWPFASSFMLRRDKAGGGPLIDWGSHIIDILNWLFGCDFTVVSYRDDGLGRVEGDCEAELTINTKKERIPCTIRLSRSRRLRNSLVIEGDRGSIEIRGSDSHKAYLLVGNQVGKIELVTAEEGKSEVEYFADQIEAFMRGSSRDIASGVEALRSLAVIEECYRKRQDMRYPWEETNKSNAGARIASRYGRVLIVGASGFLGSKLAQRLSLDLNANVRVTIHRPETAARLGRFPVEYSECDLLEQNQVMDCVDGCDIVVNCARARTSDSKTTLDVAVRGTRNLLEAAVKHNVKKFIHISSAAVHGFRHKSRTIDESAPFVFSWNPYVRGKITSEKIVMSYSHKLPVVILRPTLVFGPFSSDWVVGILERLRNQNVTLVGDNKLANLVYVDDVVDSILLAIERDEANGQAFTINCDQGKTLWKDYIRQYSDILKTPPKTIPDGSRIAFNIAQRMLLLRDSAIAMKNMLRSPEMMALLAQIPLVIVAGAKLIRGRRRKEIESKLAHDLKVSKPSPSGIMRYQTISRELYDIFACTSTFSASKAQSVLGFRSHTPFDEAMRKTKLWIDWAGLVEPAQYITHTPQDH